MKHIKTIVEKQNQDIIIEGHFSHIYTPTDKVIVLRCDPIELKDRLTKRGYTKEKIKENVEAETLDICLVESIKIHGLKKVNEVDTTNKTIEETTKTIKDIIANKLTIKPGKTNYLEEYFKHLKQEL